MKLFCKIDFFLKMMASLSQLEWEDVYHCDGVVREAMKAHKGNFIRRKVQCLHDEREKQIKR